MSRKAGCPASRRHRRSASRSRARSNGVRQHVEVDRRLDGRVGGSQAQPPLLRGQVQHRLHGDARPGSGRRRRDRRARWRTRSSGSACRCAGPSRARCSAARAGSAAVGVHRVAGRRAPGRVDVRVVAQVPADARQVGSTRNPGRRAADRPGRRRRAAAGAASRPRRRSGRSRRPATVKRSAAALDDDARRRGARRRATRCDRGSRPGWSGWGGGGPGSGRRGWCCSGRRRGC